MQKNYLKATSHFLSFVFILASLTLAFAPWRKASSFALPTPLQDVLTIFLGIILEALPFVLLGVVVSALIRHFVSPARMAKLVPKNQILAFPAVALLGILFPVCECGNLPVARQLMRQGMRPAHAITFLLAAPIINPAVIISTYAAFRFMPGLVVARVVVGFLVAVSVGSYFAIKGDAAIIKESETESCEVNHTGLAGLTDELFEMVSALAVGALIAASIQILIPRHFIIGLGSSPVAAILMMMLLALVVSLCSNVDAFFALSFANTFSASSLLAFLVFGPMVDFRSLALLTRSFKPKTIATMSVLVAEMVFVLSLLLHHSGIL